MDGSGLRGPPRPATPAQAAARREPRWRAWLAASITHRVAAAAALLATCVVVLLAGLGYGHARALLLHSADEALDSSAVLLANRVALLMSSIDRDVAGLSANSLIVNGLLDSGERQAYLKPFLRDHVLPAQVTGALTLIDHRGMALASKGDGDAPAYVAAPWLGSVVEEGAAVARIVEDQPPRLLLAYPVVLPSSRQAEGVLVVEVPVEPLFAEARSALLPNVSARLLRDGRVLAEGKADGVGAGPPEERIALRRPLESSGTIADLGLQVEVSVLRAEALHGLGALAWKFIVAGALALLLATWLARSAARRVLEPLVNLSQMAERIRRERRLDVVVPEEGSDEIGQLAASFNHMVDSLRQANQNLESEVAARTSALEQARARLNSVQEQMNDGLLVVDSHGCIESFNGGAERLFECSAPDVVGRGVARLIPGWQTTLALASVEISANGRFQRKIRALRGTAAFFAEVSVALIEYDKCPHWVVLLRDVTERERAEERMQVANRQLSRSVAELRRRDEDMVQVNRMNELLASCQSLEEAHVVIERTLRALFHGHSGALAVARADGGMLDVVARWGEAGVSSPMFCLTDCWALRLGRAHDAADSQAPPCPHHAHPALAVKCLPLSVHGETLGVLMAAPEEAVDAEERRRLNQLLEVVGEAIKFSLSNLKLRDALREAALRDGLTGLFNRRYLDATLPRELQRMRRAGSVMSVAVIDLDHFKRFNDGYGHEAGDLVLRETARVLRERLRGSDIACRVGGEELVVVLPDAAAANAAMRLEQVRDTLRQLVLSYGGRVLPSVTLSIGIAQAPDHGDSPEALLRAADRALYGAKAQGRDRIVLATEADEAAPVAAER
jgi:diguanylate cyclase (GGDEF)-like protein/PAS domain S-box-containing protein